MGDKLAKLHMEMICHVVKNGRSPFGVESVGDIPGRGEDGPSGGLRPDGSDPVRVAGLSQESSYGRDSLCPITISSVITDAADGAEIRTEMPLSPGKGEALTCFDRYSLWDPSQHRRRRRWSADGRISSFGSSG